tara:strand:+ start:3510 stop:4025 length:516 start_codon:yes stop_codon:yes gene_type:complete
MLEGDTMTSIAELSARAQENGNWDELVPNDNYVKDSLGFTIPCDGFKGAVTVQSVTFSTTSKDNPAIGIQLKTEDDILFWTNLYFSDNDSSNLITLKNLAVLGCDGDFLADADEDDIAIQLQGSDAVNVRIRHQAGDDDRIFLRSSFSPVMDEDASPSEDDVTIEETSSDW